MARALRQAFALACALLLALASAGAPDGSDAGDEPAQPHPLAPPWDLSPHRKLYSQFNEELIIRHFFGDERGGTFVDVGCSHWRKHSTTWYLEEQLGWSGIGVDALPSLAAGYAQHRPHTRFFQYIVTDHSGGLETLYVAGPVSSTTQQNVESLLPGREHRSIRVPTITLDDLLAQAGIDHVDLLSMDIEGGEVKALAGFDIARFRPRLAGIEVGSEHEAEIAAWFESHGYELLERYRPYDLINRWFAPRDREEAAPR